MTQQLKEKLADLLCNVSQLLAGYMNDDCWSDWDESVRKSVIEMQYVIEELKKLPEDPTLKNFAELCAITHRKNLELKEKEQQIQELQTKLALSGEPIQNIHTITTTGEQAEQIQHLQKTLESHKVRMEIRETYISKLENELYGEGSNKT